MKYRVVDTSLTGEIRIYRDKLIVGILRHKSWNQDAYGEFLGTMLRFRGGGFLSQKVRLWDIEGTRELGEIHVKNRGEQFTVGYGGKEYTAERSATTQEWLVEDQEEELTFRCPAYHEVDATFDQNFMEPAVILSTLYVRKRYRLYRYWLKTIIGIVLLIVGGVVLLNLR